MIFQDQVHHAIVNRLSVVQEWFQEQSRGKAYPVYSSYDIRDACFKAAVVDANIYPAGFNNICDVDQDNAPDLLTDYLKSHYDSSLGKILLLTEEHTNNAYYLENVRTLAKIIEESGRDVKIGVPKPLEKPLELETAFGHKLFVESAERVGDKVQVGDFEPELIISNNDFSQDYAEWGEGLATPINPPRQLGWYRRKKSNYFHHYNETVTAFAQLLDLDPWLFQVQTLAFNNLDLSTDDGRQNLAQEVEKLLGTISEKYREHSINEEPFVMVKNNSGTYGLGVVQVRSGDDVLNLNYKSRKKMKATKGGGGVSEVILQEGIPSVVKSGNETSEPAIYMIGHQLAGGFLRSHGKKGPKESLNSPGAVFRRLCVTDLKISVEGHPLENTYGWLAKLGLLAIGLESDGMDVEYSQYH